MYLGNEQLDLELALMGSAQCFHWQRAGEGYAAVVGGAPVYLRRAADGLRAEGEMDAAQIRNYLDLDRDYAAVAAEYAHIPQARRAIELYPGLRVLNQPGWEALVAFILSANNNVSRIAKLVNGLCARFGPEFEIAGARVCGFPSPEVLASCDESALRALGMGYRAPYLIGAARRVAEGFSLDALRNMDYMEAHRALVALPGVGDKVADCVLLFGCGQTSAFPVDVWVERLMKRWFGAEKLSRKQMTVAARERLGAHAGLLQQFLFHAARMGDIAL